MAAWAGVGPGGGAARGEGGRARLLLRHAGPGLLFAVASMGSSHFLLAPRAGAAYGYALAWTIVAAHAVKLPAFAYATRYAVAAGESLLDGFARLPGPRGWAVALFTLGAAVQSVTIVAGVTAVCAAVVLAAVPGLGLASTTVMVCGAAGILLWLGAYSGLERVSMAILALVAALTVAAAVIARPDLGALARGSLVPSVPAGAAAIAVGGLLGYMPAPIELAVLESLWYRERHGALPAAERPARLRAALLDFRIGYAASVILGLLLLSLGAALLAPRGLVPVGTTVFATLAESYRATLGEAAVPVYLLGAFLGMFATGYGVLDGFPRMVSAGLSALGRPAPLTPGGRDARAWFFLYGMVVAGVLAIVVLPDPARLVELAATGTVLVGPLWYALIVAATHRLPEPHRPGPWVRAGAWLGCAGMAAVAAAVAWALAS